MRGKRCLGVVSVVALAGLAMPAAVQAAAHDLGVTQSVSPTRVQPGGTVTVESTVTNYGTQPYAESFVELGTLIGLKGADDAYTSFSSSQGSCEDRSGDAFGSTYHFLVCKLGELAPGQTAQIHATVRVNQGATHTTILLPNDHEGGYADDVDTNNARSQDVFLDRPPIFGGSNRIKLAGLPQGCATGDFTLTATSKEPGTKKMRINALLGFDKEGSGQLFSKQVKGRRIKMRIPASKAEPSLVSTYSVVVKAKLGGGHALKATVEFTRC